MATRDISRRQFVATVASTGAAVAVVPRHVLGRGFTPPSDLLNIAVCGVGGMGRSNMINVASQNVVAMCDVDWGYAGKAIDALPKDIVALQDRIEHPPAPQPNQRILTPAEREHAAASAAAELAHMKRLQTELLPKAKRHQDYREMLEKQKDIDAVIVATPDHMHASIALAAMDLGKHVYVQKPLCWSVAEARQLAKRARETRLATQMGNQGHSFDDTRTIVEYVAAGAIGDVREVHIWTNRPLVYWPQGIPRPAAAKAPFDAANWDQGAVNARLANAMAGNYPAPDGLNWDLFLGVAPSVEYHPIYHPFNWRGWTDWGNSAIGDMGAHLIDQSMWALDLGYPTTIETVSTPFNGASYPASSMTTYQFAARGAKPPVTLTWYDGGLFPPKPFELGDKELNEEGGGLLVGSRGKLIHNTYGLRPRLLPQSLHESFGKPKTTLPRIADQAHEMNWVDAAKGKTDPSSPFEYSAKLTEMMLLGVVALRAGRRIEYDAENMRVTNVLKANDFLRRDPRTF